MAFSCVPGAGMFTPGSYAMGWTGNPDFPIGASSSRLARVSTLSPSLLSTFGSPKVLNIPCEAAQKWYYCFSSQEGESDHGAVIAVLAAVCGGKNISLNFRLEWTVEFSAPDVPVPNQELETYPEPEYIPIFTDSVSDWQEGKKLTFKHSEGGSVVPWVGAKRNVVYTPAPGVSVPYVKADKSQGSVGAFALIKDSSSYQSALACFETVEKAKEYIKKSTVSTILDYTGAGAWVTPALPILKGQEVAEQVLLDLRRDRQQPGWIRRGAPSVNVDLLRRGMLPVGELGPDAPKYGIRVAAGPSNTAFGLMKSKGPAFGYEAAQSE